MSLEQNYKFPKVASNCWLENECSPLLCFSGAIGFVIFIQLGPEDPLLGGSHMVPSTSALKVGSFILFIVLDRREPDKTQRKTYWS